MATQTFDTSRARPFLDARARHEWRVRLMTFAITGVIVAAAIYGAPYYGLPAVQRPVSPLHAQFRPSGTVGLRLGEMSLGVFLIIYLYAIRKRISWLKRLGNNRHWLDFHVVLGIAVPLVVTLHASFKFSGIAGMAFWIMWVVTLSGFVGRYFYAQIPRSVNAAELTLKEMESLHETLAVRLKEQHLFTQQEIAPLFHYPTRDQVAAMSTGAAIMRMLLLDIARPFQVATLRRKSMSASMIAASLGGLLPMGSKDLEEVISMLRRHAWLSTKISFLGKVHQILHLWHVVHRPFSYSLAVLVLVHIATEVLLGYY